MNPARAVAGESMTREVPSSVSSGPFICHLIASSFRTMPVAGNGSCTSSGRRWISVRKIVGTYGSRERLSRGGTAREVVDETTDFSRL
jgi:hypothetical protein